MYNCNAKLNFHQPLLWSSVSHDPSEIILIYYQYADLLIMLETAVLLNIIYFFIFLFLEPVVIFQDSLMNKKLKRTAYSK